MEILLISHGFLDSVPIADEFREWGSEHKDITLDKRAIKSINKMAIKSINKRINFNTPLNLENSTHLEKSDTLAQF